LAFVGGTNDDTGSAQALAFNANFGAKRGKRRKRRSNKKGRVWLRLRLARVGR